MEAVNTVRLPMKQTAWYWQAQEIPEFVGRILLARLVKDPPPDDTHTPDPDAIWGDEAPVREQAS